MESIMLMVLMSSVLAECVASSRNHCSQCPLLCSTSPSFLRRSARGRAWNVLNNYFGGGWDLRVTDTTTLTYCSTPAVHEMRAADGDAALKRKEFHNAFEVVLAKRRKVTTAWPY